MSLDVRKQIINLLKNKHYRNIAIVMHNNPDGDCIGSAVALEEALRNIGKKVDIILQSKVSRKFSPLIGENRVERYITPYEDKRYDIAFILDVSDFNRTYFDIQYISKQLVIIDHHMNVSVPRVDYYLNENDASTGITIYKLIKYLTPITTSIATAIYLTIRSDTSNFKNASTTSKAHSIASELLMQGADLQLINSIYDDISFSYIKLLGVTLNNIKIDPINKIAYLIVSHYDILNNNSNMKEAGLIIDIIKNIENVDVAFIFIENDDHIIAKARSKSFDVCQVMKEFGGGGHKCSAGCLIISDDIYKTKERIINKTIELMRQ